MQFLLKILQLWPIFPKIDCYSIFNIQKLDKYTITLNVSRIWGRLQNLFSKDYNYLK